MKKKIKWGLITLSTAIVLTFIGVVWHSWSIVNSMTDVRVEKHSDFIDTYKDEIERIETKSADGLTISAWRFKVDNPKGIVVVTHGMHGMDASSLLDYGKFFKDEGYESFVLDMRAHGFSDGHEIGLGFTEVNDFNALLDWIKQQEKYLDKPVILYGFSMGGAAAINTAAVRDDVHAVISVSAYESFESQVKDYMTNGGVPSVVINLYKPAFKLVLYSKYRVNPSKKSPHNSITQLQERPILLIHGEDDDQTSVQHAYNLKETAGENAELWIIENKGHFVVDDILGSESYWYRDRIVQFLDVNLKKTATTD